MRILVACEESQRVCAEFRKVGHESYSCDIIECDKECGKIEWHIKQDVLPLLNGNCEFITMDGTKHYLDGKWDMIIAFPPCTYLTVTGNRWFNVQKYGNKAIERQKKREEAINFFMKFVNADCLKVAIENPIGVMSTIYKKPDQIIQPYYFGDKERKSTCLWLKGLSPLVPTNIVDPIIIKFRNGKTDNQWHYNSISMPPFERAKFRSRTFFGIAQAMAKQWG